MTFPLHSYWWQWVIVAGAVLVAVAILVYGCIENFNRWKKERN